MKKTQTKTQILSAKLCKWNAIFERIKIMSYTCWVFDARARLYGLAMLNHCVYIFNFYSNSPHPYISIENMLFEINYAIGKMGKMG